MGFGEAAISLRALTPLTRASWSNPEDVVLGWFFWTLGDGSEAFEEEGMTPSEKVVWDERAAEVAVVAVMAENKPAAYDFAI